VSVYAEVFEFEGPNGRRVCDDMIELNDEERRALDELARHPEGCAEALLLSDGCTIRQLSGLVIDGYAGLQRKRVQAGGREKDSAMDAHHRSRTKRNRGLSTVTRRIRYEIEPMTLGNMRELGARSLDVSCWNCQHRAVLSVDRWLDDVPVPTFGPRMVCTG
jgi:hypothetical protein